MDCSRSYGKKVKFNLVVLEAVDVMKKKKKTSDALGRLFWQGVFRVSKRKKRQTVWKISGGYFRQNVLKVELK